jgi:prepilin-type N-terminal cleavage/methylation domain-containing protein
MRHDSVQKPGMVTSNPFGSAKGFTFTEMVVVIGILVILAGIAFPSFMQWRRSLEYRESARNIVSILRDARSRAITTNFQHRVEFNAALRQYQMTQGTQANSSVFFNTTIQTWTVLPTGVNIACPNLTVPVSIVFSPNGTASWAGAASPASINIQDSANAFKYTVDVFDTGRIRTRTGGP